VTALNGTTAVVTTLVDLNTIIGRSDPFLEGSVADGGAAICSGGSANYPNTLAFVSDGCRQPLGWPEAPDERREVHTQILAYDLTNGVMHIRAGQDYWSSVVATPQQAFFEHSIGEVASLYPGLPADFGQDFPALSYFNVFVEVEFGGNKLYNKMPMVLLTTIGSFPPDFGLPNSTYVHDPSFGAVALFTPADFPGVS
jgi:hypothetical protein